MVNNRQINTKINHFNILITLGTMNDEKPTSIEVAVTAVILAIVAMVTIYYFGWLILCALPFIGFKSLF